RCIAFGGLRVDDAIEAAILKVVEPSAIAAAIEADAQEAARRDEVRDALVRDLEAMRYAADRAFRQSDATDPANRLVAAELELRWNRALTRVGEGEARIAAHDRAAPSRSELSAGSFANLADDLRTVWHSPTTDARLKKRIVRAVIREVVADINAEAGEIILFVHWMGGIHTELRLPRRQRGQRNSTSQDIITAVRQLVLIASDELVAGILNRNKLTTGRGNRWTRERVTALRSHHKIPVYCPAEQGDEPWLNLSKAAAHLQISPKTLRLAAECGEIDALHPLPEGPWILSRAVLDGTRQKRLSVAPKTALHTPRDHILINKAFFLQCYREMGVMNRGCSRRARHQDRPAARRSCDRSSCGTPPDRTRRARCGESARRFHYPA